MHLQQADLPELVSIHAQARERFALTQYLSFKQFIVGKSEVPLWLFQSRKQPTQSIWHDLVG